MKKFARIQDGVVAETIEIEDDREISEFFPATMQWVDVSAMQPCPDQRWEYSGGKFRPPAPAGPTTAELAATVRADRDARLVACDWTQLRDVPDATSALWQPYRQALRNVPAQSGFPTSVTWPLPPQ